MSVRIITCKAPKLIKIFSPELLMFYKPHVNHVTFQSLKDCYNTN